MSRECRFLVFLLLFGAVSLSGCSGGSKSDSNPDSTGVDAREGELPDEVATDTVLEDAWSVEITPEGWVSFAYEGRPLLLMKAPEWLDFEPSVSMLFGFFDFQKLGEVSSSTGVVPGEPIAFGSGNFRDGGMQIEVTEFGALRVTVESYGGSPSATRLRFVREEGDRFWGFGEQYNFVDMAGRTVPVWVQEQGVGREPVPSAAYIGSYTDSYFPMPYFLDPVAGKGFLLENTEYSLFDLGESDTTTWTVECWAPGAVSFLIFPGPTPMDVVEQLTAHVGRAELVPPEWAFSGVWLAAQGGTQAVLGRVQVALDADVPVSAVWAQDWVGKRGFGADSFGVKYRWTWDEEFYPDLADAISQLRQRGVRFLGYFNPFVIPEYEQFAQGKEQGYLVSEGNGKAYVFPIITFEGGLLDVFDEKAGQWFQSFAKDALDMGMSGWMADFGEWLPFDAAVDGGTASSLHNLYPTRWHELNREALVEAHPDGDFVMLTRSGYTGEQKVAQVVWAGDQEADWSQGDGFPTVVTAGLTLGMAGIPFFTHDIAGFSGGPSTQELFQRWTELGAFTPVMRTHDGLKKNENHRFDSNVETLAHFRYMARIHEAFLPFWLAMAKEAQELGHPIIRHTALVDPDWPAALDAHRQWMLGADFVVAPVLTPETETVTVALPAGEWEHLFTEESFVGREVVEVDAPLGTPAVFVRAGTWSEVVDAVRGIEKP